MMENCMCSDNSTLIFACAGGSNVGQLANDVCRQLASERYGRLYCLAGIGGHVVGMVESAKLANNIVVIDGCGVRCAQKTLEAANVSVKHHIVLTDLGIEKQPDLYPGKEEIEKVKDKILTVIK